MLNSSTVLYNPLKCFFPLIFLLLIRQWLQLSNIFFLVFIFLNNLVWFATSWVWNLAIINNSRHAQVCMFDLSSFSRYVHFYSCLAWKFSFSKSYGKVNTRTSFQKMRKFFSILLNHRRNAFSIGTMVVHFTWFNVSICTCIFQIHSS